MEGSETPKRLTQNIRQFLSPWPLSYMGIRTAMYPKQELSDPGPLLSFTSMRSRNSFAVKSLLEQSLHSAGLRSLSYTFLTSTCWPLTLAQLGHLVQMQHGNVVLKQVVGFPVAILHTSPDSLLGSMLSLLHRKSSIPVRRSHIKLIK